MANGTFYHDGTGWKPTHSRPPLRRPSCAPSSGGGGEGLDHSYDATKHGAKGDGVTDDAPALNALVTLVHDAGGT